MIDEHKQALLADIGHTFILGHYPVEHYRWIAPELFESLPDSLTTFGDIYSFAMTALEVSFSKLYL